MKEEQLQPELKNWQEHKHSLKLWLPLSRKLAHLIDLGDEDALRLRDKCIEEMK